MMETILFYTKIGLEHVLDPRAYDHILFLIALAVPFTFKDWRRVLILVTVFTITHCISLALSVMGWVNISVTLVEFLIPMTIAITAVSNQIEFLVPGKNFKRIHLWLTGFFGLIHGLGFSNYFNMLLSGEEDKLGPLLGFAAGIELAQLIVVVTALIIGWVITERLGLKKAYYIIATSTIIILITIPLMINAFAE